MMDVVNTGADPEFRIAIPKRFKPDCSMLLKAMLNWYPDNIIDNKWISDFMYTPNESVIEMALADRQQALSWCEQSIKEVKSIEDLLTKSEYNKLTGQFEVYKKFIEVSIPHIEAYLRYKIFSNDSQDSNLRKLQKPLQALEKYADEIDQIYGDNEFLLSGEITRKFVSDIRAEVK